MSAPGRDFKPCPNIDTGSIPSPPVTQHLPANTCLYTHKVKGALVPSPAPAFIGPKQPRPEPRKDLVLRETHAPAQKKERVSSQAGSSSQGACVPAALSSPDRTKSSAAGIAPLGTQGLALLVRHAYGKPEHWSRSVINHKHPHRVRHTVLCFSSAGKKNTTFNCCCEIIMLAFGTVQILPGRQQLC